MGPNLFLSCLFLICYHHQTILLQDGPFTRFVAEPVTSLVARFVTANYATNTVTGSATSFATNTMTGSVTSFATLTATSAMLDTDDSRSQLNM